MFLSLIVKTDRFCVTKYAPLFFINLFPLRFGISSSSVYEIVSPLKLLLLRTHSSNAPSPCSLRQKFLYSFSALARPLILHLIGLYRPDSVYLSFIHALVIHVLSFAFFIICYFESYFSYTNGVVYLIQQFAIAL